MYIGLIVRAFNRVWTRRIFPSLWEPTCMPGNGEQIQKVPQVMEQKEKSRVKLESM